HGEGGEGGGRAAREPLPGAFLRRQPALLDPVRRPEGSRTQDGRSASVIAANAQIRENLLWLVTVPHSLFSRFAGAVGAAVCLPLGFVAVTQDAAVAMRAVRRERLDRAFEAVEGVRRTAAHLDGDGLVVLVSADFAAFHWDLPSIESSGDG